MCLSQASPFTAVNNYCNHRNNTELIRRFFAFFVSICIILCPYESAMTSCMNLKLILGPVLPVCECRLARWLERWTVLFKLANRDRLHCMTRNQSGFGRARPCGACRLLSIPLNTILLCIAVTGSKYSLESSSEGIGDAKRTGLWN